MVKITGAGWCKFKGQNRMKNDVIKYGTGRSKEEEPQWKNTK